MAKKKEKEEYGNAVKISHQHWEMDVSDSVFPKAKKSNPMDALTAKPVKDWPHTHVAINDCDY